MHAAERRLTVDGSRLTVLRWIAGLPVFAQEKSYFASSEKDRIPCPPKHSEGGSLHLRHAKILFSSTSKLIVSSTYTLIHL